MENSFHSRGSKNFVLKSDYLNNTANSKRNSKKNLSFYDQNQNGGNQKSLFRASASFVDQEDDENKKDKIKSNNMSEKELDSNLFNNNIFNKVNENNNWNKNRNNNHSNIIQEYYQNVEDEFFNNQFTNLNLSNNECIEPNNQNEKDANENKNNLNYFINLNNLSPNSLKLNNSQNNPPPLFAADARKFHAALLQYKSS